MEAFRYDGRRAVSTRLASGIHDSSSGTGAAGASGSGPSGRGTKAATLPARMQPPDFAGDKEVSIPVGTNSVGREGARHIHEAESARVALQVNFHFIYLTMPKSGNKGVQIFFLQDLTQSQSLGFT